MSIYPEFTGLTLRAIHKLLQVLALQVPYKPSLIDLKAAIQISDDKVGDFKIDDYIFEIGGKNKSQKQMSGEKHAFLALDELEVGHSNVIPLWLFGFLY